MPGNEKAVTIFPESKYSKRFREVLTVARPAEKGSREVTAGSG